MNKYVCIVCGYMYDPAAGDPQNGVSPGMAFENLPSSWVCPACDSPQSMFEKLPLAF